jgi:hypothetical protein
LRLALPIHLQRPYANLWAGRIVDGSPVPGGLPANFESQVHGEASRQAVDFHGVPAMRYSGVVDPGKSFTLYVVATKESDFSLLCVGPTWSDANRCENLIRESQLVGVHAIPPGKFAGLSARLETTIERLNTLGRTGSGLTTAASRSQIATVARRLHRRYQRASKMIARLWVRPRHRQAVDALATDLASEASDFAGIAAAAVSDDTAHYQRVTASAKSRSREVQADLRHLQRIGFASLSVLPTLTVPPLARIVHPDLSSEFGVAGEETGPGPSGTPGVETEGPAEGTTPHPEGGTPEAETEPAEPLEAKGAR